MVIIAQFALTLAWFFALPDVDTRAAKETLPAVRQKFRIASRLMKKKFDRGEPILLTCEFQNLSGADVMFSDRGFFWNHLLVVTDEMGNEAELTERGREFRRYFSPEGGPAQTIPVLVKHGETFRTLEDDSRNDLAELLHLGPGRYRVDVLLQQDSDGMKVAAKPIFFVVEGDGESVWGKPPTDGQKIRIISKLTNFQYHRGEPILLRCGFQNQSGKDVTFPERRFFFNHLIVIRDEKGNEAELTEFGQRLRRLFSPDGGGLARTIAVKVKDGETFRTLKDGNSSNDLSKLFHLGPGRYQLEVLFQQNSAGMKLASVPVSFVLE